MTPWEMIKETKRDNQFTHDIPSLDRMEWHYIFVYGTLKSGFSNHDYIIDEEIISTGATTERNTWELRELAGSNPKDSIPYMQYSGLPSRQGKVCGEVYRVSTKCICDIDALETNGTLYLRVFLPIIISTHTKQTVPMWTWIGNKSYLERTFSNHPYSTIKDIKPTGRLGNQYYVWSKK